MGASGGGVTVVLDVLIGGEVGPSLALVVLGEELAGGAAAAVPRGSFGGCEVSGGVWAAVDKSDGVTEAVVTVTEAVVTVRGVEFVEVRGGKRGTSVGDAVVFSQLAEVKIPAQSSRTFRPQRAAMSWSSARVRLRTMQHRPGGTGRRTNRAHPEARVPLLNVNE